MQRGIHLRRLEPVTVTLLTHDVQRLRVEVDDAFNFTRDIFLYQRRPFNAYTQSSLDVCLKVCTPLDLATYPAGEPDPILPYPFFRLSYLEFDFGSIELLERTWQHILEQARTLVEVVSAWDELQVTDEVWLGSEPSESESTSESLSESM